jgi:hypothetical protein
MNDSGIEEDFRNVSLDECAATVVYYDDMIIYKGRRLPIEFMFKRRLKGLGVLKNLVVCLWQQLNIRFSQNYVTKELFLCLKDIQ